MATGDLVFGPFRIGISDQVLWQGSARLKITPKSLAVLQYLVQRAGTVVSKEELYDAVWTDTHVEPGSLKTCVAKIRRVLGDEAEAPRFIEAVPGRGYRFIAPVGISNLPVLLTSFVGRGRERAALTRLLDDGRLVTVWGPAGVGKTRLAIEVARDRMAQMPHGVWWIDFSPVTNPDMVISTVAATFGVRGSPTVDTVTAALRDRRLLLVFDSCEHLANPCAFLALSILRGCPDLQILVTSREPLGVVGERVWPLSPMAVPEAGHEDPAAFESVRLFAERAAHANPSFTITPENIDAVVRICRCLDGLPLAIELAAARVRSVAAEQMAVRLDELLKLLVQRSRTDTARHQTLEAAFDWSYDVLAPRERELFASLAVFPGSFTLAAVEVICGGVVACPVPEMLETMSQLVDRALVVGERSAQESRYRLLSLVRQYAREKLPADVATRLARSHAEFFLRLAEQLEPSFYGAASGATLMQVRQEQDNFSAVMQWSQVSDQGEIGLRLAAALWSWMRRGRLREGRIWLEAALERSAEAPASVRAEALCGAGVMAFLYGEPQHGRTRLEESVALWRTTSDLGGLGRATQYLGLVMDTLGHGSEARSILEESVATLRGAGHRSRWDLALALCQLGQIARTDPQPTLAAQLFEEAAGIFRELGDAWTLRFPLGELAAIAARQREYDLAEAYCQESLTGLRPLEETYFLAASIAALAQVRFGRGDCCEAARLFGAADGLREAAALSPRHDRGFPEYESSVNELRATLGAGRFDALWTEGRTFSADGAITRALTLIDPTPEQTRA